VSGPPSGELRHWRHASAALADNPLGDPAERDVYIWTPAGWDGRTVLPAVLMLPAFTGSTWSFLNRSWRAPSLPERLDRLSAAGLPPVAVVIPDTMTALGGSQYLDSPGLGSYATWLLDELVPWVEARLPVRGRWGAVGKSSGAYGAFQLAVRSPERIGTVAWLSGDAAFGVCYPPDFPKAVETLRDAGGVAAWWQAFQGRREGLKGADHAVVNLLAMACAYSPEPGTGPLGCVLPVDLDTGATLPDVMARWAVHDPVEMVPAHAQTLAGLDGLWVEVGTRDEFRLQVGARLLHRALDTVGAAHIYVEHPGGHFKLNARFDTVLPWVVETLTAQR
jgi:S-formylglutathione hydrolase FrmB